MKRRLALTVFDAVTVVVGFSLTPAAGEEKAETNLRKAGPNSHA
jgi:hypothetical protein